MIKPLLTSQDIKNFILEEINKIDMRQTGCYKLATIARKLGMNPLTLRWHRNKIKPAFIKKKSVYYNINDVIEYLDNNNIEYNYQYSTKLVEKKE